MAFDAQCRRLGHGKGYYGARVHAWRACVLGLFILQTADRVSWSPQISHTDCFLARLTESNAAKGGPRPYTVVSVVGCRSTAPTSVQAASLAFQPIQQHDQTQGLALAEQVIADVPTDTFDLPLDAVVTPHGVYLRDGEGGVGAGAAAVS